MHKLDIAEIHKLYEVPVHHRGAVNAAARALHDAESAHIASAHAARVVADNAFHKVLHHHRDAVIELHEAHVAHIFKINGLHGAHVNFMTKVGAVHTPVVH